MTWRLDDCTFICSCLVDVYSLILAHITGCYFLACLLLLRVTSRQIVTLIPSVYRPSGPAYGNTTLDAGGGVSDVLAYSLQEGTQTILRAFGEDINYDFLYW